MQQELLRYFSDHFESHPFQLAEIDQRVFHYIKHNQLQTQRVALELCYEELQPLKRIEEWRSLLKCVLLASLKSIEESAQDELIHHWFKLYAHHHGAHFQLEQAYILLTARLLGIQMELSASPYQLEEGFSPLSTEIEHPFLNVPSLDLHAELGIVWGFLGFLTKNEKYLAAAEQVARWHAKTLDHDFKPFKGFLSSHHLSHYENILLMQGVLFHLVSSLRKNAEFAYLAKEHFGWFFQTVDYDLKNISASTLLFLRWTDVLFKEQLTPSAPPQHEPIVDSNLPILGHKSASKSFLFSLLGSNKGLGSFKFHDVEIPALGPQMQILGEEKFFGFIGYNPLQKESLDVFKCDVFDHHFILEGLLGLPKPKLQASASDLWRFPSDWLNCSFHIDQSQMTIHLRPLQISVDCYFVFYVSAEKCLINGVEKILPHCLNQYEGEVDNLSLQSESAEILLHSQNRAQKVKVIPLEGHRSFWGANYLIAYHLNNKYSSFEWKITTNRL